MLTPWFRLAPPSKWRHLLILGDEGYGKSYVLVAELLAALCVDHSPVVVIGRNCEHMSIAERMGGGGVLQITPGLAAEFQAEVAAAPPTDVLGARVRERLLPFLGDEWPDLLIISIPHLRDYGQVFAVQQALMAAALAQARTRQEQGARDDLVLALDGAHGHLTLPVVEELFREGHKAGLAFWATASADDLAQKLNLIELVPHMLFLRSLRFLHDQRLITVLGLSERETTHLPVLSQGEALYIGQQRRWYVAPPPRFHNACDTSGRLATSSGPV